MWKDSETLSDFLDFQYLKETLLSIVMDNNLSPSSVGIYGDWGSGKSSLMKMAIEDLSKDETTLCVFFNGWLFEGYEDAKTALLGIILDNIRDQRSLKGKALDAIKRLYKNTDKLKLASKGIKYGVDFLTTGGLGTIAGLTLDQITSSIKDKAKDIDVSEIQEILSKQLNSQEIRNSVKTFHNDFSELLRETKISKLIVFIDELDRCSPETILGTLEAIRLFLFAENTSFIIGADERHVRYAVKQKFPEIDGNQLDIGKEYLEKLIQYPIRIPQMSQKEIEFYIICLLLQKELSCEEFEQILSFIRDEKEKDFINFELTYDLLDKNSPEIASKSREAISIAKQLSSVLATGLNGNPRHCKRFLNAWSMREKMGGIKGLKLNRKILVKVMLLEYFKTDLFKKLAELQSLSKGIVSELVSIESGDWDSITELNRWKDDKWVQRWVKIEPKIGEIDLRPYFYFLRESLASQLNLTQLKLSPEAENILKDLINGSTIARDRAIKAANNVNESEANIILTMLSGKITSSLTIENNILTSLLEWGASRNNLYTGTISCLNEISGNKISIGAIPRLKAFMTKTGKTQEIIDIANRWATENPDLKQAIQQQFKME